MEDRDDDGPASGPGENKRERDRRAAARSFSGVAPHLSACAIEAWRGPLEHVLGSAPATGPDLDDMFDELLGLLCGDLPIEMFGTRFGTKLDARGGTLTRAATLAQSTIRTQRNEIDRLRAALQKSETLAERQGRANAAALERIKEIAEAPRLPPVVPARLVGLRTEIQRSRTAFEAVAELGYAYRREIAVSNSIASHNATLIFSLAGIGVGEGGEGEAGIEIERPGKALYTDEHRNRVEVLGPGEHDRAVIRTVILSIEREHDDEDSARVAEIPIDAFLRIMEQGITTRSQDP